MLSLPLTQAVFSLCPVTSDSEEGLYAAVKCIPDKTGGTMQHPIGKNDPDIFSHRRLIISASFSDRRGHSPILFDGSALFDITLNAEEETEQ